MGLALSLLGIFDKLFGPNGSLYMYTFYVLFWAYVRGAKSLPVSIFYFLILVLSAAFRPCITLNRWLFIHALGWIVQFAGHFIEGSRPALFESLVGTFISGPYFTAG